MSLSVVCSFSSEGYADSTPNQKEPLLFFQDNVQSRRVSHTAQNGVCGCSPDAFSPMSSPDLEGRIQRATISTCWGRSAVSVSIHNVLAMVGSNWQHQRHLCTLLRVFTHLGLALQADFQQRDEQEQPTGSDLDHQPQQHPRGPEVPPCHQPSPEPEHQVDNVPTPQQIVTEPATDWAIVNGGLASLPAPPDRFPPVTAAAQVGGDAPRDENSDYAQASAVVGLPFTNPVDCSEDGQAPCVPQCSNEDGLQKVYLGQPVYCWEEARRDVLAKLELFRRRKAELRANGQVSGGLHLLQHLLAGSGFGPCFFPQWPNQRKISLGLIASSKTHKF